MYYNYSWKFVVNFRQFMFTREKEKGESFPSFRPIPKTDEKNAATGH